MPTLKLQARLAGAIELTRSHVKLRCVTNITLTYYDFLFFTFVNIFYLLYAVSVFESTPDARATPKSSEPLALTWLCLFFITLVKNIVIHLYIGLRLVLFYLRWCKMVCDGRWLAVRRTRVLMLGPGIKLLIILH